LRVNSTQSLILSAPADPSALRVGLRSAASVSQSGIGREGAEPLDVNWTEIDVSEVYVGDPARQAGVTAEPLVSAAITRSVGSGTPAQQYRLAGENTTAKGVYLDVHA
jgi:hypothetical protein